MATPQLSPGIRIREVDLTVGRADNVIDNIGAIAGPFRIGPVDDPIEVTNETDLISTFGKPLSTDSQYEYWMSASSFLSYGGVLKVVRTDGTNLNNANAGVGVASTSVLKIKSYDDYQQNYTSATDFYYAAKNPGSWANSLKVCQIDDLADQRIGINTTNLLNAGAIIGYGVTAQLTAVVLPGAGTTTPYTGFIKGIITGVSTDAVNAASTIDVKIVARVSGASTDTGTETRIDYKEKAPEASFVTTNGLMFVNNAGINTGLSATVSTYTPDSVTDWYNEQTLNLENSTLYWSSIAPKPITNRYTLNRQGENDAIHVVVIDDYGVVSGIEGNVLEKHLSLSKSEDSISSVNSPQKDYYKNYIADFSTNLYAGYNPSAAVDAYHTTIDGTLVQPRATGFSTSFTPYTTGEGLWGQSAQGTVFSALGNVSYSLGGGEDYSAGVPARGSNGGMTATLGDLKTSYELFKNKDEIEVDYLIMGPGLGSRDLSQAKANHLTSIAELRKDCMATIGPHRTDLIGVTNTETQTDNLLQYYSSLSSSSYSTFDSGYAYKYDRFNNEFRYVPTNGDVAGLMVRTGINAYPWFSPAGQQRGVLNNVVKLSYNPTKAQRDRLYTARVNSIITKPGIGTLLFGDKTALGFASAFDRINVRRLFLTIEQALEGAAESQLFELNDELTRANFRNIVEPFLRDVEAKRGIYGFLVICDTTNNTPDVIDNNEFRADIFLKPAKSINYVTLTFVATRTGVSFEEVAGRV
jgi:hypothetical protein